MEKISRVKKYEDLRKSIETENVVNEPVDDSLEKEQQDVLHKFDSSVFKKVEIKQQDSYVPEREKINIEKNETAVEEDTFTNEYLDDFIREVREYNISKGTRESEDTQVDILAQLNSTNRAKRTQYVEHIQDEDSAQLTKNNRSVLSKESIAFEVKNLLTEDCEEVWSEELQSSDLDNDVYATTEMIMEHDDIEPIMEFAKQTAIIEEKPIIIEDKPIITDERPTIKKVINPIYDMDGTDLYETVDQMNIPAKEVSSHQSLAEETQQLRVQMDEYEDELTDLSDGVEKNNKLLNFVLCFLILVLLVIIGFIGFYIWKGGGF